ncbi:MAG: hypothetical protein IKX51_06910 [Bacteroidales bacterium]|nr:hypothetical protein [Bacteroidales bacterium]
MAKNNNILKPARGSDCATCRWHIKHNQCWAFKSLYKHFGKIDAIPTDILSGKKKHREVIDGQWDDRVYAMEFAIL